MAERKALTVGDLKRFIASLDDDTEVWVDDADEQTFRRVRAYEVDADGRAVFHINGSW